MIRYWETLDGRFIEVDASTAYRIYTAYEDIPEDFITQIPLTTGNTLCTNHWEELVFQDPLGFTSPLKELKGCVTTGKLRYDLIPPQVLKDIAEVFTDGSIKYPDESWKEYSLDKNMQSLLRHLAEYRLGETHDKESGSHNLAHLATRVIFQLYLEEYNTYPLEDRDD